MTISTTNNHEAINLVLMGKNKFYGIKKGKKVGVFETWEEYKNYINGYIGAVFEGFDTEQEARTFINED